MKVLVAEGLVVAIGVVVPEAKNGCARFPLRRRWRQVVNGTAVEPRVARAWPAIVARSGVVLDFQVEWRDFSRNRRPA